MLRSKNKPFGMTNEAKFESLRKDAIKSYESYIDAIKSLSYNDLKYFQNRMDLLKKYQDAISSNAEYKRFIYENVGTGGITYERLLFCSNIVMLLSI